MSATITLNRHKMAAARLSASARQPYLASALFASTVVGVAGSATIAIDEHWQIFADPQVVARLDVEELGRLLTHLTGHLLRGHAERADGVGVAAGPAAERWGRCADAEINDDLASDGLVPSVAPELPGDLGCEEGGLVEDYFARAGDGARHWDCGSGSDHQSRPWESGTSIGAGQGELLRLGVAAEIQRQQGERPGTVAGGWLRWAEAVLPSRTDWRRALAAEIRRGMAAVAGNADYSYRRPSRRQHVAPGIVLPSMQRPVPDVAIVCDTSGSMHERLLARALAEIDGILRRAGLRDGHVRVLAVDTEVQALRRVTTAAQVRLAGGGGTDMGRGIESAAALRPRPSIIVVLTDGLTPWPERPPPRTRVVVGLLVEGNDRYGPGAPPAWARTIRIEAASSSW